MGCDASKQEREIIEVDPGNQSGLKIDKNVAKLDGVQKSWPNLEIKYMANCVYSNLISFGEQRIQNVYCTYWFKLDEDGSEKIIEKLGSKCFEDKSDVEVILVGRILNFISSKHWAWLIRFKDHKDFEYASVEFTNKGINMGLYSHSLELSMYQVCTSMLGDSSTIEYTDEFVTDKKWGDILKKCIEMKSVYTGNSYSLVGLNCRKFVRDLGNFLTPKFVYSPFNKHGDFEFSHKLTK